MQICDKVCGVCGVEHRPLSKAPDLVCQGCGVVGGSTGPHGGTYSVKEFHPSPWYPAIVRSCLKCSMTNRRPMAPGHDEAYLEYRKRRAMIEKIVAAARKRGDL